VRFCYQSKRGLPPFLFKLSLATEGQQISKYTGTDSTVGYCTLLLNLIEERGGKTPLTASAKPPGTSIPESSELKNFFVQTDVQCSEQPG
jgi:hypothetical protein